MFDLSATAEVIETLRRLKRDEPHTYERITGRVTEVRQDSGGPRGGRAFVLDKVTARLITLFVPEQRTEWSLVWVHDESAEQPAVKLVGLEQVD